MNKIKKADLLKRIEHLESLLLVKKNKIVARDKEHIQQLIFEEGVLAKNIDVSNVTDMSELFSDCKNFNQDLSSWDVSNVTDMSYMFRNCDSFNQDLSRWDVSNVTDIDSMFYGTPLQDYENPKRCTK